MPKVRIKLNLNNFVTFLGTLKDFAKNVPELIHHHFYSSLCFNYYIIKMMNKFHS